MTGILRDFSKAVAQMRDRDFLVVLGLGIGLTLILFVALGLGLLALISMIFPTSVTLPLIGTISFLDQILSWAVLPVMTILSAVLMVPVASAFTGLFLDRIANAVEAVHYPDLPPARAQSLSAALGDTFRFLGVMVGANLVALILYFTPLAPFVFWGLNGFLLGREYAQMVAARRLDPVQAIAFRQKNRWSIFGAGVLMTVPLTIPVVNLLVPVLGAATFTHLFQRLR